MTDEALLLEEPIMYDLVESLPLNEFDSERDAHLDRLHQTGLPQVLTVHRHPDIVVQSEDAYRQLLKRLDAAECTAAVLRAQQGIARGDSLPLDEAFEDIRKNARERRR